MPNIIRREVAEQAREALRECFDRMMEINEPCDHTVGICWCDFHRAIDRNLAAQEAINAALRDEAPRRSHSGFDCNNTETGYSFSEPM